MAYPTPSIYTYRVHEVAPVDAATGENAYYEAQFSTDSGSTWRALFGTPFQSLTEAYQAIAKIVNNESQFRTQFLQATKFNNPPIVPTDTTHAYPPA